MPACQAPHEREITMRARQSLAAYANMEELIRIGAYRAGSDPIIDRAIVLNPSLEAFMRQDKDDTTPLPQSFARLGAILDDGVAA
jgi:flagellum-specific ATP synthase